MGVQGQVSGSGNYSPLGMSPECRVALAPGSRLGEGKEKGAEVSTLAH